MNKMKKPQTTVSQPGRIFSHPVWAGCLALGAAILWGFAYPLIKIGMTEFCITPDMTGSKMVFAGIRFFFSGLIILLAAVCLKRSFKVKSVSSIPFIVVFSLLNTTLHYAFFYFGLSHSEGARAAILNSLSVFLVVIFACVFFKSDRMQRHKVAGCAVGIAGIFALHAGNADSGHFTLLGGGFIILNAVCSALASLMTRRLCRMVDVFVGTGISLSLGGFLLLLPAAWGGGTLPSITPSGVWVLLALIAISTISFVLYNQLLLVNPVGKIAIYNSLIPVTGALTSCIFLHEPFRPEYVVAVALATAGILLINKGKG